MRRLLMAVAMTLTAVAAPAQAKASHPALAPLDGLMPDLEKLYLDLHQSPELSQHEEKTSAKMADRLRALGYEVTTGSRGLFSRDAIVCRARMVRAAMTTGSTVL